MWRTAARVKTVPRVYAPKPLLCWEGLLVSGNPSSLNCFGKNLFQTHSYSPGKRKGSGG